MATEYSGINYFPVQTTFFEGNTQELLEAKYGIKGPSLIMKLLCKIYKEGYYLHWGKEQAVIFAHKLGNDFSQGEVDDIINILLEKNFFDKGSYEKYHILTSESIQRMWMEATTRRKRDLTKLPYLLIDVTGNKEIDSGKRNEGKRKGNVDISSTQPSLNLENEDISKQSKAEQTKEKEKKELPPSTPPEGMSEESGEDSLLSPPPKFALNPKTHNYAGMLVNLQRLSVTDIGETKAIIRLSNYGEKGKPLWKLLAKTDWKKIATPGKYIIKVLRNSE